MARIGLCGGTWQAQSLNIDAQRAINLFPVPNGPDAVSAVGLLNTPGSKKLTNGLPGAKNRGTCLYPNTTPNRLFTISGGQLSEIAANGAITNRGVVADDGLPASIFANSANQLFITSGGAAYWFDLVANVLHAIDIAGGAAIQAPVVMGAFCDGYFLVLLADGRIQVSNIEDGSVWQPAQIFKPSTFSENPIAIIADHREVFVLGSRRGQVYWDSGNIVPFDPAPGAFIEQGIAGPWAWAKADNSVFALMADENGAAIAVRFNGYTPQRISHDGIEYTLSQLGTASQAVCYAYQEAGHTFFAVQLPNAVTTLVYDVGTGLWHERTYWNVAQGVHQPHRSLNHVFAFGKHLVGDTQSGELYQQSLPVANGSLWTFCDDNGNPIRRERITPHISIEMERIIHHQLQVHLETGLGPLPALTGGQPTGLSVIYLADPFGNVWQVSLDDSQAPNVLIDITAVNAAAQTVILNDYQTGLKSFQLSIGFNAQNQPQLKTALVTFGSYPVLMQFACRPNNLQSALLMDADGIIHSNDASQVPRGPQMMVEWSDDGGHTWSNIHTIDCGQAGQFKTRAILRRLGMSRDRVYKISMTDAVPWRIADAYVKADPGDFGPQERLVSKLRKQA